MFNYKPNIKHFTTKCFKRTLKIYFSLSNQALDHLDIVSSEFILE